MQVLIWYRSGFMDALEFMKELSEVNSAEQSIKLAKAFNDIKKNNTGGIN
jgi:hypothetical protein